MSEIHDELAPLWYDQRQERNRRHFDEASALAKEIEDILSAVPEADFLNEWSRIKYERAFIAKLLGKDEEAARLFLESGTFGERSNSYVRREVGKFEYWTVRHLAGQISDTEFYHELLNMERERASLREISEQDQPMFASSEFTLLHRIVDISFDADANSYVRWYKRLRDHPRWEDQLRTDSVVIESIRWQKDARELMINQDYDAAVAIFATFLDFSVPGVAVIEKTDLQNIRDYSREGGYYVARDHRDFARAIEKSSHPDGRSLALKIRQKGLKDSPRPCNIRYLNDIERDLRRD